jgi:hypothetical protein
MMTMGETVIIWVSDRSGEETASDRLETIRVEWVMHGSDGMTMLDSLESEWDMPTCGKDLWPHPCFRSPFRGYSNSMLEYSWRRRVFDG